MADYRATWVRLREVARQRYPDDDMAAEAVARALFDTEEAASYAADLDAERRSRTSSTRRAPPRASWVRSERNCRRRAPALAAPRRSTCTSTTPT
jgi:hypothetical protein